MPNLSGLNSVGTNGGVALLTTTGASADSGVRMNEASGYHTWTFQLIGTFTGYSVQIYGTIDPAAKYATTEEGGTASGQPGANLVLPGTAIALTSWFPLDAPSTGVGTEVNPLTATGQSLHHSGNLVAVRAVATGTGQTGTVTVLGFAVP